MKTSRIADEDTVSKEIKIQYNTSSSLFEICQPPDDSSRMKQAVVATFLR